MNWKPNTTQQIRLARASMLHQIRNYFFDKKVLEIETPALSNAGNTDPFIESIQTLKTHYLHTSPEYPMKRLLAAGSGDIYQIAKVWREGELGTKHNPEFTLLEWYRVGFSYEQLMQEVSELLYLIMPTLKSTAVFYSYAQLFLEKFSFDPHNASTEQILNFVNKEIPSLNTNGLDRQAALDGLLTHCIEPEFNEDCLTFVYDYPATQSALAKLRKDKDYTVAERFEVYLGDLELGNGYQEETDAERNKEILINENSARVKAGMNTVKIDELFLEACEAGVPTSAGVAIGLDRVLMGITDEKSIQKVINFPWNKA